MDNSLLINETNKSEEYGKESKERHLFNLSNESNLSRDPGISRKTPRRKKVWVLNI